MKTNILSLLAIVGLLSFAGCASDDTANKQQEQEEHVPEGLTAFCMKDGATRTTADYDGSGINFYWTEGDRLWVNNVTLKQDVKNTIANTLVPNPAAPTGVKRTATAMFYFAGNFTAPSYPLRYTGKGSTVGDKVTIKAQQTQTLPNDAAHIGEDGDFGVATATKPIGGSKYYFTLDHKASYVTFMPYTTQRWAPNVVIQKIRIFTGNASDALAGTFNLADDGTLSNPTTTSNSVELSLSNFPVPAAPAYATNGATMVVKPGTYNNVSIEYTLYDPTTRITGTVTKTYPSKTFTAGKNKKVTTNLQVTEYAQDLYYNWDALKPYWYGHLKPDGSPDITNFWAWSHDALHRPGGGTTATQSAKDCPNANECLWYAMRGDPHWDETIWTSMSHLYKGGMWFKKKAKISGFNPSRFYDGYDYRAEGDARTIENRNIKHGKPGNPNDYFYLPAMGKYYEDKLGWICENGFYWTSTLQKANPWAPWDVYYLYFGGDNISGFVSVQWESTNHGYVVWTGQ